MLNIQKVAIFEVVTYFKGPTEFCYECFSEREGERERERERERGREREIKKSARL